MFSTSDEKEAAIFRLPNELLVQVFSYITEIPNKMILEQVSKLFLSVSAVPGSWKGIHTLALMMKCDDSDRRVMMKGHCGQNKCLLNNYCIPLQNWPAAVQLLVDRTQIRQLLIHFGNQDLFVGNESVLCHLMEILKESDEKKVKIEYLEFHDSNCLIGCGDVQFRSILIHSLQISTPYLKEFVLNVENDLEVNIEKEQANGATDGLLAPIWPIIKECSYLESFSVSVHLFVDLSVIDGKPLRKLVLESALFNRAIIDDVVRVINGASGKGVQDLTLIDDHNFESSYIDLKEFGDNLSEDARNKLKFIKTMGIFEDYSVFSRLNLVPSMLPKLERLETEFTEYEAIYDMNELCSKLVSFLILTHDDSFSRQILIHVLAIHNLNAFTMGLTNACQQAHINAQIGESENDDSLSKFGQPEQSVLLTKGNSSIRIIDTFRGQHGLGPLCCNIA